MTLYLRPIHFVDSPQQYRGKSSRLAGSLIWFSHIEIIKCDAVDIERSYVTLNDWENHLKQYDKENQDRLVTLYNAMITGREALQIGARTIRFDQPQLMGILNITPDSFSDGGQFTQSDDMTQSAVDAGYAMASAGAAIIDIGGESTRPGAKTIWEGDEIDRILPSVERLAGGSITISLDTRKAAVMEQGLSKGAAIINDISALGFDERSIEVVRKFNAPIILMHAPSQGDNPHDNAKYDNIVFNVYDWLEKRVKEIEALGVSRDKIMIDPGIGFGKNLSDNLLLINNLSIFHTIGCPLVFGASRKRLIGALSNEADATDRLGGSLYLAIKAIEQGVHIVRVHDVHETMQSIHTWRGLRDSALTDIV